MLKDIFPQLRRLAVLSNTDHPGERSEWQATQRSAEKLGVETIYVPFIGAPQLDHALTALGNAKADAMLVFPEGATMVHRVKIAQFAVAQKLPSMFGWSEYADAGGLLSYGANQRATYARLATYADRILRGENPANLPVEQPTKFELTVNFAPPGCCRSKSSVHPGARRQVHRLTRHASSAISARTSGARSNAQTTSRTLAARPTPITGVALAMNFASIKASLIGLSAVPLAWAMWTSWRTPSTRIAA